MPPLELWQAGVLGLVEGLTEFLPISSTGHLILVGTVLGVAEEQAVVFEVFVQLGAICAVIWNYRGRFTSAGMWSTQGREGWPLVWLIALTSLPALILGWLLHPLITAHLFSPSTVAWGLLVGGVALILIERYLTSKPPRLSSSVSPSNALRVGLYQILSLWPGVSRSGATIAGGMLSGLDRKAAIEYSLLAAVPVILTASLYSLSRAHALVSRTDILPYALGVLVAFGSALFALHVFTRLASEGSLQIFGWYRIVLALLIFTYF